MQKCTCDRFSISPLRYIHFRRVRKFKKSLVKIIDNNKTLQRKCRGEIFPFLLEIILRNDWCSAIHIGSNYLIIITLFPGEIAIFSRISLKLRWFPSCIIKILFHKTRVTWWGIVQLVISEAGYRPARSNYRTVPYSPRTTEGKLI